MKTYDQEMLHDPANGKHGDCVRAVVRTLLQKDLEDAPHPINLKTGDWNDEWLDYLDENNIEIRYHFLREDKDDSHIPEICMASGMTERGVNHAVVYDRINQKVIHDPHPSRAGLISVKWYWWIHQA